MSNRYTIKSNYKKYINFSGVQEFLNVINNDENLNNINKDKKEKDEYSGVIIKFNNTTRSVCQKCNSISYVDTYNNSYEHCPVCNSKLQTLYFNNKYIDNNFMDTDRIFISDKYIYSHQLDIEISNNNKDVSLLVKKVPVFEIKDNKQIIELKLLTDLRKKHYSINYKANFLKSSLINKYLYLINKEFYTKYNKLKENGLNNNINNIHLYNFIISGKVDLDSWLQDVSSANVFFNLIQRIEYYEEIDNIWIWKTKEDFFKLFSNEYINILEKETNFALSTDYNFKSYFVKDMNSLADYYKSIDKKYQELIKLNKDYTNYLIELILNEYNSDNFYYVDKNFQNFSKLINNIYNIKKELIIRYNLSEEESYTIINNFIKEYNQIYPFNKYSSSSDEYFLIFNKLRLLMKNYDMMDIDVNINTVNKKYYNHVINLKHFGKKEKLPQEKLDIFNLLINTDPLLAYSYIANRRSLTKKQQQDLKKLLREE